MTARCLFGPADPAENEKLLAKVYNAKKLAFERKWNFSVDSRSKSHVAPTPNRTPDTNNYHWDESYDEDYMAKCDYLRYKISRVPASHVPSVTLLSAPIIHDDQLFDMEENSTFSESSEATMGNNNTAQSASEISPNPSNEKGLIVSSRSSSSLCSTPSTRNLVATPMTNFSRIRKHSSSESLSYETDPVSSPEELVYTFPSVKQRCITDYMKIKKIPRVKKIR